MALGPHDSTLASLLLVWKLYCSLLNLKRPSHSSISCVCWCFLFSTSKSVQFGRNSTCYGRVTRTGTTHLSLNRQGWVDGFMQSFGALGCLMLSYQALGYSVPVLLQGYLEENKETDSNLVVAKALSWDRACFRVSTFRPLFSANYQPSLLGISMKCPGRNFVPTDCQQSLAVWAAHSTRWSLQHQPGSMA